MLESNEFQQTVYGYWAKRFGCTRDEFAHSGTLFVEEDDLDKTRKVILYHIDKMNIVRIGPSLFKKMGLPNDHDNKAASLNVNALQAIVGEKFKIEVKSTLLDFFLDAKDFVFHTTKNDFSTRRLFPDKDNSHLLSLFSACTENDLDEADIIVNEPDPVIYGMFNGNQLVAYASHRYWDEIIADMGVLIHPSYRNRWLGKAVVSELCKWCIKNQIVPMYRVFSYHTHSKSIPLALGFKELVTIETLSFVETDIV